MGLDFTSALYLSMYHPVCSLSPWNSLTTGTPAALREPTTAMQAAKAVACLQGNEEGLLYASTLHLFWDLFGFLSRQPIAIFLDREAYPIASWGVKWAAQKGTLVKHFNHHSTQGLLRSIRTLRGCRPVVVSDGWCPQCGKKAPLAKYLSILRPYNGLLVVDDTQALGILGKRSDASMPYGYGGGGLLPHLGIQADNVLVGSSFAKAFGVPVAILSGSKTWISRVKDSSLTRVHCSPPSAAVISAALHALKLNQQEGDQRRQVLLERVKQFKSELRKAGIATGPGFFPVQRLLNLRSETAKDLHGRLRRKGIQTILSAGYQDKAQLTFLLRAGHRKEEIAGAVREIIKNLKNRRIYRFRLQ